MSLTPHPPPTPRGRPGGGGCKAVGVPGDGGSPWGGVAVVAVRERRRGERAGREKVDGKREREGGRQRSQRRCAASPISWPPPQDFTLAPFQSKWRSGRHISSSPLPCVNGVRGSVTGPFTPALPRVQKEKKRKNAPRPGRPGREDAAGDGAPKGGGGGEGRGAVGRHGWRGGGGACAAHGVRALATRTRTGLSLLVFTVKVESASVQGRARPSLPVPFKRFFRSLPSAPPAPPSPSPPPPPAPLFHPREKFARPRLHSLASHTRPPATKPGRQTCVCTPPSSPLASRHPPLPSRARAPAFRTGRPPPHPP